MAEDKNKPSYKCAFYNEMSRGWSILQDTCAGTLKLREKGAEYLPKEPAEQDAAYLYRLRRAIFFNAVDLTLGGLVGMVFRNDPKLADNVPQAIRGKEAEANEDGQETQAAVEGHWENIDNAGTHGVVFSKELFNDAMRDGHAAILVDMPPALEDGSTLADEKAANRRPYWVSYCADQIINWRTSVVNGQTQLDLIVFKEKSKEPDGEYGEKEVTRYRVFKRTEAGIIWELYREVQAVNSGIDIVFENGGPVSLPEIPVAIVYSHKCGILRSHPPLLDLAMVNITHYQKYNDFSIYIHLCRPILWFRGRDTSKKIETIGPYVWFDVGGENGMVDFAEPKGASLGGAREDIKDLEERMSIMGLSLLVKRTGPQVTATEEKGDQIEESSELATAARSLKDALELALKFHTQYLTPNATTGGNVELGAALDELEMEPAEMTAWSSAVSAGQFTTETMWKVFQAGGKLPDDFDAKKEKAALQKEAEQKQKMEIDKQAAMDRNFTRGGAAEE